MLIPSEVIKGGEAAVTTYLKALNETAAAQLTKRCKICVVGPSTWGKTTLVKSLSEAAPSLVDEEDRTIGIDLFSLTFPPEDKVSIEADRVHDGNSRYDVIFWDFAGQEIYQTTHAMFFSNRTLYLVCIHLQVYAEKLRNGNTFKPDAHFKLIGTKSDLVPEASQVNRDVGIDLSSRLTTFIEDPGRSEDKYSFEEARVSIRETIRAKPRLTFDMPTTYTQVLEEIVKLRREAKTSPTHKERLEAVIVSVNTLVFTLRQKLRDLKSAEDCQEILRTLHELGEVMWYEEEDVEFGDLIILDPTVMLDIVRDVVNYEYEGKDGEHYNILRQSGTLQHTLLMTSPLWSALQENGINMVLKFKQLLMRFKLVYPASYRMSFDSDLIVPAYWKPRLKALRMPLSKQKSVLRRHFVDGREAAKWKYSIPVGISEAIFVNFVVRSYRSDVVRLVNENYFECFVPGEFGAAIYFITDDASKFDDITIEVAAGTRGLVWAEMQYFVIAMEQVLHDYPGLDSTKGSSVKRCIVDANEKDYEVNYLIDNTGREQDLRGNTAWFPPDFKCQDLKILQLLQEGSEKRLFPAVWTISYPENSSTIELTFIQSGISILSIAALTIPFAIVNAAVMQALEASSGMVKDTSTAKDILDRAHLLPGENKSSKDMAMPLEARMDFLRELLMLYDPNFKDSAVSEASNLRRATRDGHYVWVHESERRKLDGYLTPCADISLGVSDVEKFHKSGRTNLRKKVYCVWEIIFRPDTQACENGQTEKVLWKSDAGPLWTSSAVKLDTVDTVEMLGKCTLKVWVYQARHLTACFRKDKEIGQGEKVLQGYDHINESRSFTIKIPISATRTTATASPPLSVICQIDIEYPSSKNP
ncbi:hypothetical protein PC110_g17732 [Phytophthora cactorum]|uniref:P-loop containing nucleoside triphosphate hydrolase n=1 Tax=Phytophthora cactorum TaxID=29920 RepID=A0A329RNC1_9STRA|nr:hypothetical protein PC119_g9276 [Phytophthora cactorum]RAW25861.1 hypothetical protein PC110_g17732 [Phytophthora cactorum]